MAQISDARIQFKCNTASIWELDNPVLFDGEIIFVDTAEGKRFMKIGDGVSSYNELPLKTFAEINADGISTLDAGLITEF